MEGSCGHQNSRPDGRRRSERDQRITRRITQTLKRTEMRLTLGRKLGLGFGVILTLIVVDTTLTYRQANAIKMNQDRAMEVSVPSLETCRNFQTDLTQTHTTGPHVTLARPQTPR